jgi:hypothetical protein
MLIALRQAQGEELVNYLLILSSIANAMLVEGRGSGLFA